MHSIENPKPFSIIFSCSVTVVSLLKLGKSKICIIFDDHFFTPDENELEVADRKLITIKIYQLQKMS